MGQWHHIYVIVRCPSQINREAATADARPNDNQDSTSVFSSSHPINTSVSEDVSDGDDRVDDPTTTYDITGDDIGNSDQECQSNEPNELDFENIPHKWNPPKVPFEYVPVACLEHPMLFSISAVRCLLNVLTALSSPSHRRAVAAELAYARKLGVDKIWNSRVTPCPYISSLVFAHACCTLEIGAATQIAVAPHQSLLNRIYNNNGITVIDVTDMNRLRYAYVDILPGGMECQFEPARVPYMTPLSAERYLMSHANMQPGVLSNTGKKIVGQLVEALEQWEVLDVYTLDSAFPDSFNDERVARYDPGTIVRDPFDWKLDRWARETFESLEKLPKSTGLVFPTLQLLAVKGMLLRACADDTCGDWLRDAVHQAPTTLPMLRTMLPGRTHLTEELYCQKGFGRVLAVLIPALAECSKKHLDLSPYALTEENITEFLIVTSSSGRKYNSVEFSNQEHLTDNHLALMPTAFPSLKTLYLLGAQKPTIEALSRLVSAYKFPPRIISTTLNTSFLLHSDSDFCSFPQYKTSDPKSLIPDPDLVLKPSSPWPGYATQIVWTSATNDRASVCHACLIHPFDVLVGVYNFVVAYANREGYFEQAGSSAGGVTGAFGMRSRKIDGLDYSIFDPSNYTSENDEVGVYNWLDDGGPPFVRQRTDSPQYNLNNMDDALPKGEWRVFIRTRLIAEKKSNEDGTSTESRCFEYIVPNPVGRAIAVAFFRVSPDDDTEIDGISHEMKAQKGGIKIDASLEDITPDEDEAELTEEQKSKMSPRELLEYRIASLTKLANKLQTKNDAINSDIKASRQRIQDAKAKGIAPKKVIRYEGRGNIRKMEQHTLRSFIDTTMAGEMAQRQRDAVYEAISCYTVPPYQDDSQTYASYKGGFLFEELDMGSVAQSSANDSGKRGGVNTPPRFV